MAALPVPCQSWLLPADPPMGLILENKEDLVQLLLPRRRQSMDSALEEALPQLLPVSSLVHLILLVPRRRQPMDSASDEAQPQRLPASSLEHLLLLVPRRRQPMDSASEEEAQPQRLPA